jgi:uncharacterized protein
MRCAYCFYADVSKRRGMASYGFMTPHTCETLVQKALNYADGVCTFGFQGGEPTLAGLDFYVSLIKYQREYNLKNVRINNSIQTNGYRLGKEWAEFFAEHNFLVGLSIDGTKTAHDGYRADAAGRGTYDAAVETAELLDAHSVEFNILCVVNNAVASNAGDVYDSLRKYKYLQFIPCIDDFGAESDSVYSLEPAAYAHFLNTAFDAYYRDFMRGDYVSVRNFDNYIGLLLGNPPEQCGMSGVCSCYFLVEADGSVFPCDFYVLDAWKIGNVNENSFARMLRSGAAKEFVGVSEQVHADCRACDWRGLCRGGCRRYREPAIDGVLQKNKLCPAYLDFFGRSYEKMVKIAEKLRRRD